MNVDRVINGDCLQVLKEIPDNSIDCCVTSPPYYGLRDYGMAEQIGLEETPEQYIQKLVDVFHEVKRCLKDDGTLWLNIGDSYAGSGKGRNADGTAWVKEGVLWTGCGEDAYEGFASASPRWHPRLHH